MLEGSLPRAVVFIDRTRLQFFGSSVSGIATLEFPQNTVSDLEVLNQDALYVLLKQFVEKNKIDSCPIVIVLSDTMYFSQAIASSNEGQEKAQIAQFFDSIPFDAIRSKVYKAEKGLHVVAANKDFTEAIIHGFEQYGFVVDAVVPTLVMGKLAGKRTLDPEMGKFVLASIETVRKHSLYAEEEIPRPSSLDGEGIIRKNQRQFILIGIFVMLLVVLGVMVVLQMRPQ